MSYCLAEEDYDGARELFLAVIYSNE